MKNILKKIIRFFKKRPVYAYIGVGFFIVLFAPKYFVSVWLSSWIFYFYFYTIIFFIFLFELCKPIYFLSTRNMKKLYAFLFFNKKPTKTLLTLRILEFLIIILALYLVFPVIKYTIVSLVYEDVSIKRVYTVKGYDQGAGGFFTDIYIADSEFDKGNVSLGESGLYTFLFLHPYRPKPGQRYFFHYLPVSSLKRGIILDYYPVDENGKKAYQ